MSMSPSLRTATLCLVLALSASVALVAMATGTSLFLVPHSWVDAKGQSFRYQDFSKNKISVVAMVFTHCQASCPLIVNQVQKLDKHLSKTTPKGAIGYYLFSFDSKRETPKTMNDYLKHHKLPYPTWNMFTADKTTVQTLALVLNVKYKQDQYGDFGHSNLITLIDHKGEQIGQYNALNIPLETLTQQVAEKLSTP